MNRTLFIFCFIVFLNTCSLNQAYESPSCSYGTLDAWISFDGLTWYNTTYDHAEFTRGEPFFIKTIITTTEPKVHVSMNFFEVGVFETSNATFEIVEGIVTGVVDQGCDQIYSLGIVDNPTMFEHIWVGKVRENATWVNGTTPLNIITFFNKRNDNMMFSEWDGKEICFTVVNAFISPDYYEVNNLHIKTQKMLSSPSVPFLSSFGFIILATIIFYKKMKK